MTQVEIPPWTPPWRVVVRDRLIRVSAAHVRGEERWECPTQIAVKARPTLQVDRDPVRHLLRHAFIVALDESGGHHKLDRDDGDKQDQRRSPVKPPG